MEAVHTNWSHDGMIARRNGGVFAILDDFAMPQHALRNLAIRSCLCPIFQCCHGALRNFVMPPKSVAKFPKVTKIESFFYDLRDMTCIRKLIVHGHQENSREVL